MAERGAGLPKTDLSSTALTVGFGQTLSMRVDGQASGWFGPQRPLAPVAPDQVAGRQWDLPPGYNLQTRPRVYEPVSFDTLRSLADGYDLLRLIIETRKDQIERMRWSVRPREGKKENSGAVKEVMKFLERPDGEHGFAPWLRMLLEDLFVIDAPTLWKQRTRGGQLIGLMPLDGATIKRVIDDWGRTPRPYPGPGGTMVYPPAYQQVLHGFPAIDYTIDELIYAPRNIRTSRVYGYSPVEQIIMTVNIALRRQLFTLSYFTEGNIPESLIGVPDAWTPDQIKNFQDYWDLYFTGDLAARRKAKFVPGGVAKTFIQTKEPEMKGVFDEWLAKICCFAFSISSQPFVSQVNRATANTQKEQAEEEGLGPILQWVKHLLDPIIAVDLGHPELEFAWNEDKQVDPASEAQILVSYVNNGVLTRNEVRDRLGEEPYEAEEADLLGFTTATGFIPLEEDKKPEPVVDPLTGLPPTKGVGTLAPPDQQTGEKGDGDKGSKGDSAKSDDTSTTKKLDEIFDLAKQEGHDVSTQPRDSRGRFGSTGGPTYRERKKAEAAARRLEHHDDAVRDRMGRFKSSGFNFRRTMTKVMHALGTAAAIGAATGIAAVLVDKFGNPLSDDLSKDVREIGNKMARSATLDAIAHVGEATAKAIGIPQNQAKMFGRGVANVVKRIAQRGMASHDKATAAARTSSAGMPSYKHTIKETKWTTGDTLKRPKVQAPGSIIEPAKPRKMVIVDMMKADDMSSATAAQMQDGIRGTAIGLSMMLEPFAHALADQLESHGMPEDMLALVMEGVHEALSDIDDACHEAVDEVDEDVSKMTEAEQLQKVVRRIVPISDSRPVVRKARASAAKALARALEACGKRAARVVAAALSERLGKDASPAEGLSKATDPLAAAVARSLDLDELLTVSISADLEDVASDAAQRTLVRIGPEAPSELISKVSDAAADWARRHAAEITGHHTLEDGTRVQTTRGGYTIQEGTRDIVRDVVSAGLRDGLSADEIVQKMVDRGFSEDRAQLIAETEIGNANSGGTLEAYRGAAEMGVSVKKMWQTVGDDDVDEDICQKNEDQGPIPIDEPFQSGHMAPLGHPRCRCTLVPVVDDEEDA